MQSGQETRTGSCMKWQKSTSSPGSTPSHMPLAVTLPFAPFFPITRVVSATCFRTVCVLQASASMSACSGSFASMPAPAVRYGRGRKTVNVRIRLIARVLTCKTEDERYANS